MVKPLSIHHLTSNFTPRSANYGLKSLYQIAIKPRNPPADHARSPISRLLLPHVASLPIPPMTSRRVLANWLASKKSEKERK
jgi:hypothetical protein